MTLCYFFNFASNPNNYPSHSCSYGRTFIPYLPYLLVLWYLPAADNGILRLPSLVMNKMVIRESIVIHSKKSLGKEHGRQNLLRDRELYFSRKIHQFVVVVVRRRRHRQNYELTSSELLKSSPPSKNLFPGCGIQLLN